MNTLQAGFSRVNITPMLGIGIAGYFIPRQADGVLDELEINALAVACGDSKAVLMTVDHCGIVKEGYFPMMECYEEGGYEAGSSNYKAGVAEILIKEGLNMLAELK